VRIVAKLRSFYPLLD